MYPQETLDLAASVVSACKEKGVMVATAESCTGGLIAGALTAVSGSSAAFERGFNTYSNEAKNELLGVSMDDINAHGAVSETVARQMAEGALRAAPVKVTAAVTGIAGPDGGTPNKPVGTVDIASAYDGHVTIYERFLFPGDRDAVRLATVNEALKMILRQLLP